MVNIGIQAADALQVRRLLLDACPNDMGRLDVTTRTPIVSAKAAE